MIILKSFCSAFLMFSRIPMPNVEWKEENKRYALCFFPFIGVIIGGFLLLWQWLCAILGTGSLLFSAICVILPIIITGGIHVDGFCDVIDAESSCRSRERKLEIMKDSHTGAFAVIYTVVYFLLAFGLFSEINTFPQMLIVSLGFVMSRTLSAFAAVTFKSAKSDGTLQSFVKPAHKKITLAVLAIIFAAAIVSMLLTDVIIGTFAVFAGLLTFAYYRIFSYKKYSGITGDMAGYFLQLCELAILAAVVTAVKITAVI